MRTRSLVLALASVLLVPTAAAADLYDTWQLARLQDPQLAASEAGQRATQEGQVQTRAALLPQVDASASLGLSRTDAGPGDITRDSTTRSATIGVSQVVYNQAAFSRNQAQQLQTRAGEHDLKDASDSLITRTSQAYFNVLIAMETLAAAEAQETALRKQFEYASKRLEVGLAPITDQHEARAQYESARANTILRRNALEDTKQALAEITGQPIENMMALPDDFKPQLPSEGDAEHWVQLAVDNNPALAAQKTRVEVAEQNIQTARAGHLPTVSARGSYGYQDSGSNLGLRSTENGGWSRSPSVSLSVSVPLYAGGAVQSQVRQAIAQRDVSQQQLEQQKRALERSTRSAYQSLAAGISTLEARRLALVSAQSAYDASQVGLEVGTRTVLDVLINQQSLFNAQQAYAEAKYSYLQSHLALRQAAGMLDANEVQAINRLLTVPAGRAPKIRE